jgi:cytidylate kinase
MVVKGAFEKARFYIESHSKDSDQKFRKKKPGPCITISRETGAGADKVSEELIEFFQNYSDNYSVPWTVFDKNLIERVLEDHHLPQTLSQYFVEDKLSELKSTVNELLGLHPNTWILVSKTSNTILQLAQLGNCVIVGRAGNIIASRLKNSFHVRLVAPAEARIGHIMDICDKSRPEAIEYIRKEDLARKNYLKKYFNKDVADPLLYNMVINTALLGYKKVAEVIGKAVLHNYSHLFYFDEEEILVQDF